MYVKFLSDWRGYRAGTVRAIGAGEGELLILRKFAQPADDPRSEARPHSKTKRKRVKRARTNGTADAVAGQSR